MSVEISQQEFKLFQKLIYDETGIALHDQKATMVQARLSKRVKALGLPSFKSYYDYIKKSHEDEILNLLSAISTNVTSFFREAAQWEFLEKHLSVIGSINPDKRLRIWSSASSTGQEPYSIAIFLQEHLKNFKSWDIKFLASDIDPQVLKHAIDGVYSQKDIGAMPKYFLTKYFDKIKEKDNIFYRVKQNLRDMILFRMFNLTRGDFSIFKNKFDIIFCRNVMIYFDTPTKDQLFERFHAMLKPEGLLFLGHSESITKQNRKFELVQSAIYKRI